MLKKAETLLFVTVVFIVLPFLYLPIIVDPDIVPRFMALGILLLCHWGYIISKSFTNKFSDINYSEFKRTLFILFVGYVLISGISFLLASINPGDSIFEFLKTTLILIYFSSILVIIKDDRNNVNVIIKAANLSTLIFSIAGMLQLYLLTIGSDFYVSVTSTLANKNTYSGVVFVLLPFAVYGGLFFISYWKVLSLLNIIVILFTIIILHCISVWVALFMSLFVFLLVFIIYRKYFHIKYIKNDMKYRFLTILSVILIFIVLIGLYYTFYKHLDFGFESKLSILNQYYHSPELLSDMKNPINNNSFFERIFLTKGTIGIIRDNFIFGIGLDNWKLMFDNYISRPYFLNNGIRFQTPENDLLFIWAESGIFGISLYLLIYIITAWYVIKIIKHASTNSDKFLCLLMLSIIIGFMTFSLFVSTKNRFFPIIIVVTMISIVVSKYHSLFPIKKGFQVKTLKIIGIYFILSTVFCLVVGYYRLIGEIHLKKMNDAHLLKQNFHEMIVEIDKASSYFFIMDFTSTPLNWYRGFANYYLGNTDDACRDFKKAQSINPYHMNILNDLGTCYEFKADHDSAIYYYKKAIKIFPFYDDVLINLSAVYFNSGKLDDAYNTIISCTDTLNEKYKHHLGTILHTKAYNKKIRI